MLLSLLVASFVSQAPVANVVELPNGMRWVLLPRPSEPRVSGLVMVNVGGVHERQGEAGVAHLLEHLAFSGTPIVGARTEWRLEAPLLDDVLKLTEQLTRVQLDEGPTSPAAMQLETKLIVAERDWEEQGDSHRFDQLYALNDVDHNAWTTWDDTTYWGDFPPEQLHLWLAAEAQRFAAPVFRDFRRERAVVLQESIDRLRSSTTATSALWQLALGGDRSWVLSGTEAEVRAALPSTVEAFYARLYAPSNAVGVLVGNFEPAVATRWLHETFALIPSRQVDAAVEVVTGPPATRTIAGRERRVLIGFAAPPTRRAESPAFELAEQVLWLDRGVIGLACAACTRVESTTGPGPERAHLLGVSIDLAAAQSSTAVVDDFFFKLSSLVVDDEAFERARALAEVSRATTLRTRKGLAQALARSLLFGGDASAVLAPRYRSITRDEVERVLRGFTRDRAWVVIQETP